MKALVVRLDSFGDVLLAGPAIRAVAARADHVTLLCGPRGAPAAALLPGVDDVLVWDAPWVGFEPPPVGRGEVDQLIDTLDADTALILTSFHQSPLPAALLLRLAGVPHIAADSEDYPGSLLDVRHQRAPHVARDLPAAVRLILDAPPWETPGGTPALGLYADAEHARVASRRPPAAPAEAPPRTRRYL